MQPYAFFLCHEIVDLEKAQALIPDHFRIVPTRVFEGDEPKSEQAQGSESAEDQEGAPGGFGGGGGGGGGARARPVAVIHISGDGVSVEPVVDVTKLGLAFFALLGSIFAMRAKVRKRYR